MTHRRPHLAPKAFAGLMAAAVALTLFFGFGPFTLNAIGLGDKAEHILAFAAAMTLLRLGPGRDWHPSTAFLALAAAAYLIEPAQVLFTGNRTASFSDFSASLIGCAAGLFIASAQTWTGLAVRLALLGPFAVASNWAINTGRYRLAEMLGFSV